MSGWIKLHRKIFDNPYYFSETFCRSMAWVDLLLLANHEPGFFYKRGIRVELSVGQLGYDTASLAKRWKWSRNKCERWFRELEKDKQIVRQKTNVTTIISIVNYEIYQSQGKPNGKPKGKAEGKAEGKADEHEQEYKECKEVKKYSNIPPTLEEIKLRFEERNLKNFSPEKFHAHYMANGWMVGRNKMKNWDSALTTWEFSKTNNYGTSKQSDTRSVKRVNDFWNNPI
jgi:hypothetical protein